MTRIVNLNLLDPESKKTELALEEEFEYELQKAFKGVLTEEGKKRLEHRYLKLRALRERNKKLEEYVKANHNIQRCLFCHKRPQITTTGGPKRKRYKIAHVCDARSFKVVCGTYANYSSVVELWDRIMQSPEWL